MPRKGWSQMDTPSGWVQIIRGPRPRAAQWPRAQPTKQDVPQKKPGMKAGSTKPVADHVPPLRAASRPPEAMAVDAAAEVERLESAIAVLGEANPHARPLKDALQAANPGPKCHRWPRGWRLARNFSNGPSVELHVPRRSSTGPNRGSSTWRKSRRPRSGCWCCRRRRRISHQVRCPRSESCRGRLQS